MSKMLYKAAHEVLEGYTPEEKKELYVIIQNKKKFDGCLSRIDEVMYDLLALEIDLRGMK